MLPGRRCASRSRESWDAVRPGRRRGDWRREATISSRKLTCEDVIGLLLEYLEASLPPEVIEEFEAHLAECPACVAYLNTYRKTRELTGEVTRIPMPEEMQARLRAFLREKLALGA